MLYAVCFSCNDSRCHFMIHVVGHTVMHEKPHRVTSCIAREASLFFKTSVKEFNLDQAPEVAQLLPGWEITAGCVTPAPNIEVWLKKNTAWRRFYNQGAPWPTKLSDFFHRLFNSPPPPPFHPEPPDRAVIALNATKFTSLSFPNIPLRSADSKWPVC